jgi:HlyD family secretion protein
VQNRNIKLLFIIAILGIVAGLVSAIVYNRSTKPPPPTNVNFNPYKNGVYATGIVESLQPNGQNVSIFPEVAGKITAVYATDGQSIKQGDPILAIDDSVQKEIVAKDLSQAQAAQTLLAELKAEPRPENLNIAKAQLDYAYANLKNVQDQLIKVQKSYQLNPKSISKNNLDNATNAVKIAQENLKVANAQYILVKAGAWSYDIQTQEQQYQAAEQAYLSDKALLDKFVIKSPITGKVLRMNAAVGSYVSPQGIYDPYTEQMDPVTTMGVVEVYMEVRCYLDEVLVPKLPAASNLTATMLIRGMTNKVIPLEFIRLQPYTTPKIQLSDQQQERVDVRVLPIIFRFKKPADVNIFAGQLVDVYIKGKQ